MKKLYEKMLMQRYLHSGCEDLYQHYQMIKWIKEKGLVAVYEFMQDIFGNTWNTHLDVKTTKVQNHVRYEKYKNDDITEGSDEE